MDLRASQRGLKTSQKRLGTSHWDQCTGGQNFSLIYRTLSPMGAAAQHDPILANWGKNFQNKLNKMPKGIMRLPIPLPCFFDEVSKDSRAAAQTGDEVLKNEEKFPPSIHLSFYPSFNPPPSGLPSDPAGLPSDTAGWLSDPAGWPSDPPAVP